MMNFEQHYFEVLSAIETAIVMAYELHPDLRDHLVDQALDNLKRVYGAIMKGRNQPALTLRPLEQACFDAVKTVLDAFLLSAGTEQPITHDEAIQCIKRIQKSINQYQKLQGTPSGTGYLDFLKSFRGSR
ncbi:MAG: hypothetical protein ACOYLB_01730 [Phototrophicaceae bacterium]